MLHTESKCIEVTQDSDNTFVFKLDDELTNVVAFVAGYETVSGRMVDIAMVGADNFTIRNNDSCMVSGTMVKVFIVSNSTYTPIMPVIIAK